MRPKYLLIINLLSEGFSCKEIAHKLNMPNCTVETYKILIYREFGVKNAAHLISYCYKNQILKP